MKKLVSALVVLFSLAACTPSPIYDYDSSVDLSQYNSFAFLGYDDAENENILSLDAGRAQNAVTSQLKLKGIEKVDADPDLLVSFDILEESELQSYGGSFGVGYSSNRYGVGMRTPERYREVKYGKLVVEVADSQSRQVVWRAQSQRKLSQTMSTDKRSVFINEQIDQMFSQFPQTTAQ
ncbi:DUF4136 domain-containing protein [Alginatibacterium sediminis]|nr:DUF4136 domain-containing protein [Alginatibacterium sediminis]